MGTVSWEARSEVEVEVECDECGGSLETTASTDNLGNVTLKVEPCEKCMEVEG
jgi:hypothetical protein